MASVRTQWRVVLAGHKFEIETNALDQVKTDRTGQPQNTHGMRTLHHACLRERVEGVPVKFDDFLSQLDDVEEINETAGEVDDDLDPTQPVD